MNTAKVASAGKSALRGVWNFDGQNGYWSWFSFVQNILNVLVENGFSCMHRHTHSCTNPPLKKVVMNATGMQGEVRVSLNSFIAVWVYAPPLTHPSFCKKLSASRSFLTSTCPRISVWEITNGHKPVINCSICKWGQRIFLHCVLKLQVLFPTVRQKDRVIRTDFFFF